MLFLNEEISPYSKNKRAASKVPGVAQLLKIVSKQILYGLVVYI